MKAAKNIYMYVVLILYTGSLVCIIFSFSVPSGIGGEDQKRRQHDMENGTLLCFSYGTSQVKAGILRKEWVITHDTSSWYVSYLWWCTKPPQALRLKAASIYSNSCVCWSTGQASLVVVLQIAGLTGLNFSLYTGLRSPSWRATLGSEIRRQIWPGGNSSCVIGRSTRRIKETGDAC